MLWKVLTVAVVAVGTLVASQPVEAQCFLGRVGRSSVRSYSVVHVQHVRHVAARVGLLARLRANRTARVAGRLAARASCVQQSNAGCFQQTYQMVEPACGSANVIRRAPAAEPSCGSSGLSATSQSYAGESYEDDPLPPAPMPGPAVAPPIPTLGPMMAAAPRRPVFRAI